MNEGKLRDDDGNKLGPDGRRRQIFTPGIASPPPHLAGREEHLARLREEAEDMMATGGGGQPILVFGPRGMGKTVLLEEFENNPPGGVDIRCFTPSTGLHDINSIPGIFLSGADAWSGWRRLVKKARAKTPEKAKVELPLIGAIGYEFKGDMNDAADAARIKIEVIKECAASPKVLIIDEAHTLTRETGRFFLNFAQSVIKSGGRLQLVLAGTANLRHAILQTGASFIVRGDDLAVGPLSADAARDSIRIPVRNENVEIEPGALDRVVEDSQKFPFFLQSWGKELWKARINHGWDEIGWDAYADAEDAVNKRKASHYSAYLKEIMDWKHLMAANALADAFKSMEGREDGSDGGLRTWDALAVVLSTTDPSMSAADRWEEATEIMERLKARDVLWEPDEGVMKPALPSFLSYIRRNVRMAKDAMERREPGARGFGHPRGAAPSEAPDPAEDAARRKDRGPAGKRKTPPERG